MCYGNYSTRPVTNLCSVNNVYCRFYHFCLSRLAYNAMIQIVGLHIKTIFTHLNHVYSRCYHFCLSRLTYNALIQIVGLHIKTIFTYLNLDRGNLLLNKIWHIYWPEQFIRLQSYISGAMSKNPDITNTPIGSSVMWRKSLSSGVCVLDMIVISGDVVWSMLCVWVLGDS